MNRFQRNFILTLVLALFFTLIVGTVNFVVDPYYSFGNNTLGAFLRSERPFKERRIKEFEREGMLIGNSKIAYINTGQFKNLCLFNASFSGSRPEEILAFLDKHLIPREVLIVGFDFFAFNGNFPFLTTTYFQKSLLRQSLENAFTLDGFIDSFEQFRLREKMRREFI